LKAFLFNLKACLGLVLLNHCSPIIWFRWIYFVVCPNNLLVPTMYHYCGGSWLWLWLWLKYNIVAWPYYYWWIHAYRIKAMAQLYQLSSEKKMLCCQLCSTRYTAVRINSCFKITSAIKVAFMKITDNFHYKWKPSHAYHKIDTL